jgi:SAM-dependent methyltransferase
MHGDDDRMVTMSADPPSASPPTSGRDARAAAKAQAQATIDAAGEAHARGGISGAEWQRRVSAALSGAYLREDDPRWQSGFDGDERLWRAARSLVLDAVPRDGSLLDVGCANGHLMESLDAWARERGLGLELYGLEIDPALAETARRRLPAWAERIFTANASDWVPPRRFDFVRTGLEYVPPGRGPALVARLLRDVVAPGGRLIVGPVNQPDLPATLAAFAAAGIADARVESSTDHNGKTRCVVWAERTGG